MSLSYVAYPADGATTQFDLTFGYLSRSHVFVFVDDILSSYRWITGTRVELNLAPNPGQTVKVQRLTDRANRLTDFSDGQTLLSGDLNAGDLQNFYILQELLDQIVDGVLTGAVPVLDNGQGYITEQWINEQLNSSLEQSAALASLLNRIVDEEVARATAIAEEAQQRLQGLSAEASARVAALQTVTDNLANEVADRITAVQGVASDLVDEVSLRVLGDTDLNAAIVSESQARQDADVAFGTQLSGIVTRMGDAEAAILTEATARSTADDALSQLLTVLTTRVGDAEADIVSEQQARTSADAAIASDVTLLTTRVGDAEADIISEQTARSTADAAIVSDVNALTTRVGDAEADILSEQTARSTADAAIVSDVNALTTRVGDAEADILSEQTARSTADAAIVSDLNALTTRVGDAEADIISEQTARTTADTAITTDLSALTTRVGTSEAAIITNATAISNESSARATETSTLGTRLDTAEADITSVEQAVVDETAARALDVSTLQAAITASEADLFLASLNDILVGGHLVAGDKTRDASAGYVRSVNVGASDEVIFDNVPSTDWGYVNIIPDAPLDVSGYRYVVLTVTALSAASPWLPVVRWLSSSGGLSSNGVQVNPSGYLTVGQKTTIVYDMAGITAGNGDVWDTANAMTRLVVYGNQLSQAYSFQIHDIAIVRQSDNPSGLNTSASLVDLEEAVATTTNALASDISSLSATVTTVSGTANAANTRSQTNEAGITAANQAIANETTARSTAFDSLDARVVSSLSNDADFVKNPSAAYGTVAGYTGNRLARDVGVSITTDSGVPSGAAFTRYGTDNYIHKPGTGLDASDLGWYKEGGWGGTAIRIRGWFKTPDPSRFAEVGVHLVDTNFQNLAWPRVPVSTPEVTDWVWFDDVFIINPNNTQEVLMPFIRNSGSGTNLIMYEQLSWMDVTDIQNLNDTVSTQAASIAAVQLAIADEAGARASAISTVEASVSGVAASVTTNAQAIAGVDGQLQASYGIAVDGSGNASIVLLSDGSTLGSAIVLSANEIVLDGDVIINGTITTNSLAVGAVSNQEVSENSAALSMSTATWVDAATLTFDSVGIGVELRGSAVVSGSGFGGGPGTFKWRVLRGATVIKGPFDIPAIEEVTDLGAGVFQYSKTANFVADTNDVPSSGTHTYKLQVYLTGNGGTSPAQSVSQRYFSAREFKR